MAKKKKRRLNYKRVFTALVVLFLIIYLFIGLIKLIFKSNLKINIGEEYFISNESGVDISFKATYKKKDVTSNVEVTDISYKSGKYEVTFTYREGKKSVSTKKLVRIKDSIKPSIILKGGTIVLKKNEKYNEPGYTASDNLDKDITKNVKITNNIDSNKEGTYEVSYTVRDNSGNEAKETRVVKVVTNSPTEQSLTDFSLDGYFTKAILKETSDMGENYANSFVFAGDSTFIYYKSYYPVALWKKNGATSEQMLTAKIDVNYQETGKTLVEMVKEKKPEKIIIALGENSVATEEKDFFISNYRELIKEIKESSPNTVVVIQSILPVPKATSLKGNLTNEKINKYNYYLAEMCEEENVYFLNVAESLKNSEGHLKSGYEKSGDINHIGKEGSKVIHNYIRTHGIK